MWQRPSSGSPRHPSTTLHPLCTQAYDREHTKQSSTRLGLLLAPKLESLYVTALVLHHSFLPHNSNTHVQAGIGASCMPKMHSCSCRAFMSEASFPYLYPCSYIFFSGRRKTLSLSCYLCRLQRILNPRALIPCKTLRVEACRHNRLQPDSNITQTKV